MDGLTAFADAKRFPTLYTKIDWRTELPGQEKMIWGKMIPWAATKRDLIDYLKPRLADGRISFLDAAFEIACWTHAGDTRKKANEPYMEHVLRVTNGPACYPELNVEYDDLDRALALCHDVLEVDQYDRADNWAIEDFEELGFSEEFTLNLAALKHDKFTQHYLLDYIQDLSMFERATKVKLVDNFDNDNTGPSEEAAQRYQVSKAYLLSIHQGRLERGADIQEFAQKVGLFVPWVFIRLPYQAPRGNEIRPK